MQSRLTKSPAQKNRSPKSPLKLKASAITRAAAPEQQPQQPKVEDYLNEDLNSRAVPEQEPAAIEERKQVMMPRQESMTSSVFNANQLTNMQDHFMEIMNNEQVEDVVDLNEKFLAMALGGIEVTELAVL